MADLAYDKVQLAGLGTRLTSLACDLEADAEPRWTVEDVAMSTVVNALSDFANEWEDKRKELAKNVRAVGELAGQAAEAFGQGDEDLAKMAADIISGSE